MTTIDEMDEFLNLEALGGPGQGVANNGNDDQTFDFAFADKVDTTQQDFGGFDIDPSLIGAGSMTMDPASFDLALENVDEDDFSFSALQHFGEDSALFGFGHGQEQQNQQSMGMMSEMPTGTDYPADFWETPQVPCVSCTLGGYSCKKIREGRYKGYCTSCVALSVDCSFGLSVPDVVNPDSTLAANNSGLLTEELHQPVPLQRSQTPSQPPSNRSSSVDLTNLTNPDDTSTLLRSNSQSSTHNEHKIEPAPPKIGARFSRESVRILKTWLTTHNRHPYPSDEEKELLQRKTGLSKTQITNWLANARRRGKVQTAPRSTSPHPGAWSTGPMDIPQRRGTPALETMNPLQRWEHSPPEHEPASITAISRAVTASSGVSSGKSSPFTQRYSDDGSSRSLCNQSSASSLGTSQSSNGSSGAWSYGSSRHSWGSFGSAPFNSRGQRRRRRRRAAPAKTKDGRTELGAPLKTFQCTFCTETFRTKHDWQRHEKSLHLSLERWVCAPHGPRAVNPEGQLSCIYCGVANPDDAHIESHNHSTCQERSLEERTFYRKDHLNQHLRLVHNVKFMDWSMKSWKVASPEIRSRCGFCGIVMDSWTIRVDHLAEHFKTGYSMKDWQGDWGFDVPVLDMVENSIPPYLIHHERTSPLPFVATDSAPESPRNAYELIKLELAYFDANHREQHGRPPTDEELMVEGCRIIFASETLSLQGIATQVSWLRDLIMSSDELMRKARFGPLRGATENRMASLKINGKDNLFEQCPMEYQLHEFSQNKRLLGLTPMDYELQEEACRIVGRVEEVSTHPSDNVANWLLRIITSSTNWLAGFRRRAHLPSIDDIKDELVRSTDPTVVDSNIHTYTRLERELADYAKLQRSMGVEPTDEDLQRQARIIIYEFDDGWNQTAADNLSWLEAFKARHPPDGVSPPQWTSPSFSMQKTNPSTQDTPFTSTVATDSPLAPVGAGSNACLDAALDQNQDLSVLTSFVLNDANCYRRLSRELGRWAAATMSPNNPNSHVPTDAELQHQARWILYDEDDPWNQTAADNPEWLRRFKRTAGIVTDGGPTLSNGETQLSTTTHSTSNNPSLLSQSLKSSSGFEGAHHRYDQNTHVFVSKPLEDALISHAQRSVQTTGFLPCSEALKAKAQQVMGMSQTPADDTEVMGKFQRFLLESMPHARPAAEDDAYVSGGAMGESGEKMDFLDTQASDEELMGMEFDMSQGQGGREHDGGVKLDGMRR